MDYLPQPSIVIAWRDGPVSAITRDQRLGPLSEDASPDSVCTSTGRTVWAYIRLSDYLSRIPACSLPKLVSAAVGLERWYLAKNPGQTPEDPTGTQGANLAWGQCDIDTCKPLPPSAVAARELALTCIESVALELQPNCWKWHRFTFTAISFHAACRAGRTREKTRKEISSGLLLGLLRDICRFHAAAAEFMDETRCPRRAVSRLPSAVKVPHATRPYLGSKMARWLSREVSTQDLCMLGMFDVRRVRRRRLASSASPRSLSYWTTMLGARSSFHVRGSTCHESFDNRYPVDLPDR